MNDYLKVIGQLAGLDDTIQTTITKGGMKVTTIWKKYELISTHTARRSMATNLFKSKFPSISIMKITGYKTEKAFLTYIKITPEENASLLQEHWKKQVKLKIA